MANLDTIPDVLFNVFSYITLCSEPQRRLLLWNLDHEKPFRIHRSIFKLNQNGIMGNTYNKSLHHGCTNPERQVARRQNFVGKGIMGNNYNKIPHHGCTNPECQVARGQNVEGGA
jgi:hypothetical protein